MTAGMSMGVIEKNSVSECAQKCENRWKSTRVEGAGEFRMPARLFCVLYRRPGMLDNI